MSAAIAISNREAGYRLAICMHIWEKYPREFERILRVEHAIDTRVFLGMSVVETTLRRMQSKLIW